MATKLTTEEQAVLDISAELWNRFLELPPQHSDDVTDFRHALHALQRIVMARPVQRVTEES